MQHLQLGKSFFFKFRTLGDTSEYYRIGQIIKLYFPCIINSFFPAETLTLMSYPRVCGGCSSAELGLLHALGAD